MTAVAGEHAGRGLPARGGGGDLRGDLAAEQARAVRRVAVVGGADEHAGVQARRRRGAAGGRPALDERLERAEASARLDEPVGAVAGADRGGAVGCARRDCVGGAGSRGGGAGGRRVLHPALLHHHPLDRQPRRPAAGLQPRPHRALVGPADAEVGDRVHARRDAEDRAQVGEPVEAHPADAEALGARGEPEVLDRAGGAVDVGVGDRPAAEDLLARLAVVTADADAQRRLDYSLDLLVEKRARPLVEASGLAQALARRHVADRDARRRLPDDDEPPGLHEPDRRRAVGGGEDAVEHVAGHRIGPEAADVAALGDDAVDRLEVVVAVAPAARIGGALRRAGRIVSRGRRRPDQARRVAHAWRHGSRLPPSAARGGGRRIGVADDRRTE